MDASSRRPEIPPSTNRDVLDRLDLLVSKLDVIVGRMTRIENALASHAPLRLEAEEIAPPGAVADSRPANPPSRASTAPEFPTSPTPPEPPDAAPDAARQRRDPKTSPKGETVWPGPRPNDSPAGDGLAHRANAERAPDPSTTAPDPDRAPSPESPSQKPAQPPREDPNATPRHTAEAQPPDKAQPAEEAPTAPTPQNRPQESPGLTARPRGASLGRTEIPGRAESPADRELSWWQRIATERQVGRYLLSLAASLLIIMAAASLIALLWDSIPDYVKILIVAAAGILLTGLGAKLATRPHGNRVAAATILGTGGGLMFVAVIGTILLAILPVEGAFGLLTAWSLLLSMLAVKTRIYFAALITCAGGIITVILTGVYGESNPDRAVAAIWAGSLYAAVLAGTFANVARIDASDSLKTAYVLPSLMVTVAAAFASPLDEAAATSTVAAAPAFLLLPALAIGQYALAAHWLARRWPSWAWTTGWGWVAVDALLVASRTRTLEAPWNQPWDDTWMLDCLLAPLVLACLAMAILPTERTVAIYGGISSALAATFLGAQAMIESPDHPAQALSIVVAVCLCAPPAAKHGQGAHAIIAPLALLVMNFHLHLTAAHALLALVGAAVVVATMAAISARASDRSLMRAATWVLAAILAIFVPVFVSFAMERLGVGLWWSRVAMLATAHLACTALILAGIATDELTPSELLRGRGLGRRSGLIVERLDLPGLGENGRSIIIRRVPPGTIVTAAFGLALQGFTLVSIHEAPQALHKLVAVSSLLALGGAIVWMAWPLLRGTGAGLIVSVTITVDTLGAMTLFTRDDPSSVPGSIAILAIGTMCIAAGFLARSKFLRTYGLAAIMVVVVKFAAMDMAGHNSLVRVLALLVAGIVCFALSLAYSRFSSALEGSGGHPAKDDPEDARRERVEAS